MEGNNSFYSSHSNKNRFGRSANPRDDPIEIQSIKSSEHGLLDQAAASIYSRQSKNYNPFYHPQGTGGLSHQASTSQIKGAGLLAEQKRKRYEEQKKEKEQMKEIVEEWGFQNDDTRRMFEARLKKQKAGKKKKGPSRFD